MLETRAVSVTEEYKDDISKRTKGILNPNIKLKEDIYKIINLMSEGWLNKHIADEFNLDYKYIYEIRYGKTWGWMQEEYKDIFDKIHIYDGQRFLLNINEIKDILNNFLSYDVLIPVQHFSNEYDKDILIGTIRRVLVGYKNVPYLKLLIEFNPEIQTLYAQLENRR